MAWLRKYVSKNTFLTLIGVWNAITGFVAVYYQPEPIVMGFIITLGNLAISWLGVESGPFR